MLSKNRTSDGNKQEKYYCENDGENRIYCKISGNQSIDRFYNNHLKSRFILVTLVKNNNKRIQLK